jgi:hypothetical protein
MRWALSEVGRLSVCLGEAFMYKPSDKPHVLMEDPPCIHPLLCSQYALCTCPRDPLICHCLLQQLLGTNECRLCLSS